MVAVENCTGMFWQFGYRKSSRSVVTGLHREVELEKVMGTEASNGSCPQADRVIYGMRVV